VSPVDSLLRRRRAALWTTPLGTLQRRIGRPPSATWRGTVSVPVSFAGVRHPSVTCTGRADQAV